ncbi:MAG: hypothetical protein NTV34_13225, partial [Proteobacteria bacterium]|nr:hypothetical protein [Pseudomonadota bacterium]
LTRGILLPITTTTTHPPTRLDWAKGDPISHKILHAFDEAIARYVDPLLTPSIRAEAQRAFYKWTEEEPPLGREWLNEFSANLGASEQAKLKYVICAGLTPLRLSAKEIDEQSSGDAALFLALWACFNVGLQLAERVGLRAQLNR